MPDSTCSITDCENPTRTRGWCLGHYKRWLKTGDPIPAVKPERKCDFEGCGRKHNAYGLCTTHGKQLAAGQELRPIRRKVSNGASIEDRLRDTHRINPRTGCWEWTMCLNDNLYGELRIDGKHYLAHRISYLHRVGPIPEGMHLDHTCGVPQCVNPAHLRPVTNKQNSEHKTRLLSNNSSGYQGVCYREDKGMWRAYATAYGKQYWGGYHDTAEQAAEAARTLRNELFTHNDRDRAA